MSPRVIPASQRLTCDLLWHLFGHVSLSDPHKGPMSVSQVSQQWRHVALYSPFIWSNITIRLYTSSQRHLLALAHFRRSQNVPITLTIYATRPFKSWEKEALLLPHAHRFRSLHIKSITNFLVNLLWMEMDMPMPRLKAFETVIKNTSRLNINRKILSIDQNLNIIPPISDHHLVDWASWNTFGLTTLTLDTTYLWNRPDLDGVYHALANACHTLQHFEYQGPIPYINNAKLDTRLSLKFRRLRSLTVNSHGDMVPLLRFMSIPALDSLTLRDFIVYPTSATAMYPINDVVFDSDGLLRIIKQWTSITHLEIFGIDDLPSTPPKLLDYIKSLNQLSSLVLYGIGAATSIAYTLFMHDSRAPPLLPMLRRFLLAISDISPNDNLCNYLIARQRHRLPRLQRLTINLDYFQYLGNLGRLQVLLNGCNSFFVLEGPDVGQYIPIKELSLRELYPNVNKTSSKLHRSKGRY